MKTKKACFKIMRNVKEIFLSIRLGTVFSESDIYKKERNKECHIE